MEFSTTFETIELKELKNTVTLMKAEGWQFTQLCAVTVEGGVDLIYSFEREGALANVEIKRVTKDDVVPSISDDFFSAFVFENETHDLFGINIKGIVIDFAGKFYDVAIDEPMTVISPEKKEAMEKAAKIAAAKAAKAAKEAKEAAQAAPKTDAEPQAEATKKEGE